MKYRTFISALLFVASAASLPAVTGAPAFAGPKNHAVSTARISTVEAAALLSMREEEKLARDVYLNLFDVWRQPVFEKIAASEQRHFDALGAKIEQFGLSDPALPGIGEFSNVELRSLYDQLLADGRGSYGEALWVGATIEDMDIRDLQAAIEVTSNRSLITTYQNLMEGSKNHLRRFVGLLEDLGVTYTPQYIDPVLYDAIIGQ